MALLLPNGSVLKTGSTGGFAEESGGHDMAMDIRRWFRSRTDAERFLPGYLWRGPRPTIDPPAGERIRFLARNATVQLQVRGEDLSRVKVALIRLGAVTHGYDNDQRYVWLAAQAHPVGDGAWRVDATVPRNPAAAPPGDYQLVVLDSLGVPSPGEIVRVQ